MEDTHGAGSAGGITTGGAPRPGSPHRFAPTPTLLAHRQPPSTPAESHAGALLVVSSDRFAAAPDQWWATQASVFVPDQAPLRRGLEGRGLIDSDLDALVSLSETVPLAGSADRLADSFLGLLERALRAAGDRPLEVRVSEARWAAVLREYQWLFPTLQVLPGHDSLVARLSAACMRIQLAERRRTVWRVNAGREWASFAGASGRGHVALRGGAAGSAMDPLAIASDGAHNPRRGTTWGYFTSHGGFRLGVCEGSIAVAELCGLTMAVADHPDQPLVVFTDSRRALTMLRARMHAGIDPADPHVARRVRGLAELIEARREGGQAIAVRWVRAHSARLESQAAVLNDAADRMAKLALRRWCTPGLDEGVEDVALAIAREAAENLRRLVRRVS